MANFIDRVEVNGTEYEIVGPEAEYPLSNVVSSTIYDGSGDDETLDGYSNNINSYNYRWKRTGEEGNYEYKVVLCLQSTPEDFSYQSASACTSV